MAKDLETSGLFSVPSSGRPSRRRKDSRRPGSSLRQAWDVLRDRLRAADWTRVTLVVGTVAFLSLLLSSHLLPDKVSLRLGDKSDQEIRAVRTVQYPDKEETAALRQAAAAAVDPIYTSVPATEADQTVREVYALLRRERLLANQNPIRVNIELREQVGVQVEPPSLLAPLLRDTAGTYHLDQAERLTRRVIDQVESREIRDDTPDALARARADITARIAASVLPRTYVPAVAAVARAIVHPNRLLDANSTLQARKAAERLVPLQYGRIFAGEIVLGRNEIVTRIALTKLAALGLQNPRLDGETVASVTLLVLLMAGVVGTYLARYQPAVFASNKLLGLLSLLVILSVLGLKLGSSMLGVRVSGAEFGYVGMLCVAATGMLIAALINPRVAMLVVALLAAQSGLILGNDLRFTVMTLLSSVVAVFSVSDIRSRGDVLRAGATLCATNVALSVIIGRLEGDPWVDVSQAIRWAAVSGLLSVALFSLGAALFERPFGITTHLGLLELSDPNRPLLQRFSQQAPGTYIHSVMVGNLAVAAAEAIDADVLLCRVGAYYHDLGKMRRPEFFVENQRGGENVHERLNPSLSALVVAAHVKDGLEIADEEKLPPVVKAFITEHHGTSLIRYFYHRQTGGAAEAPPGLEQRFRYGGPKPQTRETAILMLADGVEAASRTLEKPTPGRLADLVEQIITAQLSDGQLDECDLTLRDLRGIREAFLRLLTGMRHSRIEYPDLLKPASLKAPDGLKTAHAELAGQPPHAPVSVAECPADTDEATAGTAAA